MVDGAAKKVIFLDVDGVLNNAATPNPRKFPYIVDAELLSRLREVIAATGAQIVLSSTWRYDPVGLLAAKHYGIHFVDITPDLPHKPRRDEILEWIRGHADIGRFIVIDDEDDELDDLPLFQPSAKTGLDSEIAEAAIRYLNGASDDDMRRSRIVDLVQDVANALKGHSG